MSKEETKLRKLWESLPEGFRFNLEEALSKLPKKDTASASPVSKGTAMPARVNPSKEAEAVLSFIHKPRTIMTKKCKHCNLKFGSNYVGVAFCSDVCRAADLLDIGIIWDSTKTSEERWEGEPPNTISPQTYAFLERFARHILLMDAPVNTPTVVDAPVVEKSALQLEMEKLKLSRSTSV